MLKLIVISVLDYLMGTIISIRDGQFKYQDNIKGVLFKLCVYICAYATLLYEANMGYSVVSLLTINEVLSITKHAKNIGILKGDKTNENN